MREYGQIFNLGIGEIRFSCHREISRMRPERKCGNLPAATQLDSVHRGPPILDKQSTDQCRMYLSQIAKYICLKLEIVFVSICKMYLSQSKFVSHCKMYLIRGKPQMVSRGCTQDADWNINGPAGSKTWNNCIRK